MFPVPKSQETNPNETNEMLLRLLASARKLSSDINQANEETEAFLKDLESRPDPDIHNAIHKHVKSHAKCRKIRKAVFSSLSGFIRKKGVAKIRDFGTFTVKRTAKKKRAPAVVFTPEPEFLTLLSSPQKVSRKTARKILRAKRGSYR